MTFVICNSRLAHLGPPRWGFCIEPIHLPRVARCFAVAYIAPPWADIASPLRGFYNIVWRARAIPCVFRAAEGLSVS
jgi:hypothetical protein